MDRLPSSDSFEAALFRPIDIASLVYARIVFGLVMLWEVTRYFQHGWIRRYWIEPSFHFTFPGFDWVAPLPGDGMYWLFVGIGLLSILITIGLFYRIAATLLFVAFTYIFLLEQAHYLNHFYLVCLLGFVIIFLPANRSFSLDARWGFAKRSDTAPAWTLWSLRFLMGVVYFYGGIAKINSDWLTGYPLHSWLHGKDHYPLVGEYLTAEPVVLTLAWGGMLFDLLIPFLLLWKPTRLPSFLVAVGFHLTNVVLWQIGIFPWLAIALTATWFSPSWPRRFFRLPRYGVSAPVLQGMKQNLATAAITVFCIAQLAIPFRHWAFPGDVVWTEEGHRFSWRMKLRTRNGRTHLQVVEKDTGKIHPVNLRDHIESWQELKMKSHPDMILQLAHHLSADYESRLGKPVSVHARSSVSVNGRPHQEFFSPDTDLSRISRFDRRAGWIHPFRKERNFRTESSLALE